MSNFFVIKNKIKEQFDQGERQFIIFPYGENGILTNTILKECFGMDRAIIIDNELYKYNPMIKSMMYLKTESDLKKYIVLFASYNEELLKEFSGFKIKIVDLFKEARKDELTKRKIQKERESALLRKEVKTEIHRFKEKENLREKQRNLYTDNPSVGRYSYGPLINNIHIGKIGAFCSFAVGCDAVWNHQLGMVTNHNFIYESVVCKEITNQKYSQEDFNQKYIIGNDVWFGKNVLLTNGVKVGNGVIAAAGAVITRNVPDYAIVAGVPARIINYRFTEEQVKKLNEIAWWDWPIEKIKDCYDDFMDIEVFIKKHYKGDIDNEM